MEAMQKWLDGPYDDETKKEIQKLQREHPQDLAEAFGSSLTFGTAGMREIMGVGTCRINRYTIQMATQGVATALKNAFPNQELKVFIGYDSRHHSQEFARAAAEVFSGNGIDVYLPDELCTTQFTSFACRELGCHAAVMITASHNPPEYNGYKVYWQDGAQVVAPHDAEIVKAVKEIWDITQVQKEGDGKIHSSPAELYSTYYKAIAPLALYPNENREYGKELKIIYTSLHGSGTTLTPKALHEWGFTGVHLVEKQCFPDGNFPTAPSPNPESADALQMGMRQLQEEGADILLANDPDADRIGTAILHQGKIRRMSGNEIAALCLHHILQAHEEKGTMPPNPACVTTIVTTELFGAIAESFNVNCMQVLTGFKYIGEKIYEWEDGSHTFLFGAEESMGYLLGTHCRDKDGSVAACLISEMALKQKRAGKTLFDYLEELYAKYGVYREKVFSHNFKKEEMANIMETLRHNPPKSFFGKEVVEKIDYLGNTPLPKSNVLLFRLSDQSKIIFRPSGTEPKIKTYLSLKATSIEAADQELEKRGKSLAFK